MENSSIRLIGYLVATNLIAIILIGLFIVKVLF